MNCNCIKDNFINFRFTVDQVDEETLNILEHSDWNLLNKEPNKFTAELLLTDGTKKEIELNINTVTRLESKDLGSFCDGVYCLSTVSCGVEFKRRFALTHSLECGLAKVAAVDIKKATEISGNIKEIHNLVELNNINKAISLFTITEKILKNYNCECK
jgi:hypothetical protein